MCLAVPMRLVSVESELGKVEQGGVTREVSLALLPDVRVGQYVLVHAGFAIQQMNEEEAQKTLALLEELLAGGETAADEKP